MTAALSRVTRLDGVIHSAGILCDSSIGKLSQQDWDKVTDFNSSEYPANIMEALTGLLAAQTPD